MLKALGKRWGSPNYPGVMQIANGFFQNAMQSWTNRVEAAQADCDESPAQSDARPLDPSLSQPSRAVSHSDHRDVGEQEERNGKKAVQENALRHYL